MVNNFRLSSIVPAIRRFKVQFTSAFAISFCAFLILLPSNVGAQTDSNSAYGAYGLFPQGSSRVMGMGGAFVAVSDDATGMLYNPAGLATSKWNADFGGTNNKVDNREIDLLDNGQGYGAPYSVQFYNLAVRAGSWVFGAGYSSPYNMDQDFTSLRIQLKVQSIDAMVARKFGDSFAIGITGHHETLTEVYENNYAGPTPYSATGKSQADSFTAGVIFKEPDYGLGLSYRQGRHFKIDSTRLNGEAGSGTTFFRDVVIPSKATAGVFYRLNNRVLTVFDVDYFDKVENAVVVGSDLGDLTDSFDLDDKTHTVFHGGFEWKVLDADKTTVILRAGGYQEPSRLKTGGEARTHITMGFEIRFGPAVLSVAFDQASRFNNTSQGFSLSLGDI